ncbi:MAG: aminomethyl-transferring glycine dehydrogenase subunit GcvPB [Spirochaetia bacterium]|nr:aminomethyl-transferring glycine dehydrogenase subunit GcvPB [Spirochaetia bacterium]
MKTIFEKSIAGRHGVDAGTPEDNTAKILDAKFTRIAEPKLPELSELDVIRHFTRLSRMNYSVDTEFYPLGSCTMKYNPKVNEAAAVLPGFKALHPFSAYLDAGSCQGALELIYRSNALLCEVTGMKDFTGQPYAGAHGELTGIFLIAAYHRKKGNKKKYIIVPDSAHGTNPASAAMAGYAILSVPVDKNGTMDVEAFRAKITDEVAGVMMTVPSTLGVFENRIKEIADIAHSHDALMYYDGANLNAILGKFRPGDAGFDVMHINLHKTFSTPHGGGGPGSGMVGVGEKLIPFLPVPRVVKNGDAYSIDSNFPDTIGQVASFFGNFGVIVRAFTYIIMLGREGLINVSEMAVLNANYIMAKLKPYFDLPYDRICAHECVFSAKRQAKSGVYATDIAKALIDRGFHPPTIYFPLVVEEAVMIEPTETESKEMMDSFIAAMIEIAGLAQTNPGAVRAAPVTTETCRPDETKAARELKLTCF